MVLWTARHMYINMKSWSVVRTWVDSSEIRLRFARAPTKIVGPESVSWR